MEYKPLGRTGLYVSKLCLGTMEFGTLTDEKEAFAIMDRALDLGINFFDTADVYGYEFGEDREDCYRGKTEEIIGRWFRQGGGRRERTVLATKCFSQMCDPLDGPNDRNGLSTYIIRRRLEASLRRLQTEHIELYMMHRLDRDVTYDELWDAYYRAFMQGTIDYVGTSCFGAHDLVLAQQAAREKHFLGIVAEQHHYSLLKRQAEMEVLPTCKELGIGVMIWSPRASGRLARNMLKPPEPNSRSSRHVIDDQLHEKLTAYSQLCQDYGYIEADVAVAWMMQNDAITCPIIGVRTIEQLDCVERILDIKFDDAFNDRLDEIFPSPGLAPDSYIVTGKW
ncbi:aldo/keto reductase [Eubacteriales bacterium OttesenSCG-928-N14]|nr:aldo/keto reductase [Eubacteriales bacterium OttesenSCG-928-N14]